MFKNPLRDIVTKASQIPVASCFIAIIHRKMQMSFMAIEVISQILIMYQARLQIRA